MDVALPLRSNNLGHVVCIRFLKLRCSPPPLESVDPHCAGSGVALANYKAASAILAWPVFAIQA